MIEELISRALAGNPDAEYELGCLFMDSEAGKQDAVGATKWWKSAATKDHPDAQFRLGEYLYDHSEPDGISWLTKAAQSGSDNAWNKLEQAAEQDLSRDARFSLGQLYLSDHGNRPRNLSRAAHWLKEAALDGVPEALAWLLARLRLEQSEPFGDALREVLGTETHYIPDSRLLDATCGFAAWCLDKGQITEAVHYFSAAARHGHLQSLEELLNSLDGDNPELFANAIEEILLEGILGDGINAIPEGTLLATAFQFGQKLIKLGDSERAVGWLSAAARQGEVRSLFELLDHVEGDNSELFIHALENLLGNDNKSIPEADLQKALFQFGQTLLRIGDCEQGVKWLSFAARKGDVQSLYVLLGQAEGEQPTLFLNALDGLLGVDAGWIDMRYRAAAVFKFGLCHLRAGNYPQAAHWFAEGAKLGSIPAIHELYKLYCGNLCKENEFDFAEAIKSCSPQWVRENDCATALKISELLVASGEDEAQRSASSSNVTRGKEADIIWALSQIGNVEASSLWSKLKATENEANKFAKTALDRVVLAKQFLTASNSESAVLLNRINSLINQIATNTCVDPTIRKEAEQQKNKPIEPPPVFVSSPSNDSRSGYYPSCSNDDFVYGLTDT